MYVRNCAVGCNLERNWGTGVFIIVWTHEDCPPLGDSAKSYGGMGIPNFRYEAERTLDLNGHFEAIFHKTSQKNKFPSSAENGGPLWRQGCPKHPKSKGLLGKTTLYKLT